ncbi:MAG: prepilin peptidase [Alphaproteobacteria bacterium]|nr:prepilin peptidase [Alphaproteobacteria bacterium]
MEMISLYLVFAMCATLYLDVTRYTIPNWLVGSLLALYPVAVYLSPQAVDWKMALAAMAVTFLAGYAIFALRVMGGGDIKLITALALWVGWNGLLDFVLLFAILGGVFSVIVLIGRKLQPYIPLKGKTPKLFQKNAPIPYGVAIAGAFLWMMWKNAIPTLIQIL